MKSRKTADLELFTRDLDLLKAWQAEIRKDTGEQVSVDDLLVHLLNHSEWVGAFDRACKKVRRSA